LEETEEERAEAAAAEAAALSSPIAHVVAGAGACPPDDCGRAWYECTL
jgi:hypothetical protein